MRKLIATSVLVALFAGATSCRKRQYSDQAAVNQAPREPVRNLDARVYAGTMDLADVRIITAQLGMGEIPSAEVKKANAQRNASLAPGAQVSEVQTLRELLRSQQEFAAQAGKADAFRAVIESVERVGRLRR